PLLSAVVSVALASETSTAWIYPLSLHDALPILERVHPRFTLITQNVDGLHQRAGSQRVVELHGSLHQMRCLDCGLVAPVPGSASDRKSTRLNSSHVKISYAVFCLKKKKNIDDGR